MIAGLGQPRRARTGSTHGTLIVNADDFGRSRLETDVALACFKKNRISSATAMMFMEDSERAAELANEAGIDVGLHLNLSQRFTAPPLTGSLEEHHERVVHFLKSSPYAVVLYNPMLRRDFRYVYQAQVEEFVRLYGRRPSHIDGHQHRHLCANILLDNVIPGQERVRRNFSYWPNEKNVFNRSYRSLVDNLLGRRYKLTNFFFSLSECLEGRRMDRVFDLAQDATVELMTHPVRTAEYEYLLSDQYLSGLNRAQMGTYADL